MKEFSPRLILKSTKIIRGTRKLNHCVLTMIIRPIHLQATGHYSPHALNPDPLFHPPVTCLGQFQSAAEPLHKLFLLVMTLERLSPLQDFQASLNNLYLFIHVLYLVTRNSILSCICLVLYLACVCTRTYASVGARIPIRAG